MDKNLDCKGLACPLPVVEAKKAMEEMQEGILTVLVDNETAVQNLQRLGQKFQYAVASQKLSEKEFAGWCIQGERSYLYRGIFFQ